MVYLLLFLLQLVLLFFISRRVQGYLSRLFLGLTGSKKASSYLFAIIFLPGTYIHELSHVLVSLLLFVPVGKLELIPKLENNQLRLGSVTIGKTDFIRRFIIGIAPLIIGIFILLILTFIVSKDISGGRWWDIALYMYLVFTVSNTMFMSKRDLEGGWKLALAFLVVFLIMYFAGFRATLTNDSFVYSENFTRVLTKANLYLLFPLAIDFAIVMFGKLLEGDKRR